MSIKATFVLDDLIVQQARECVRENHFKSLSAFVEGALRSELERIRQEKIRAELQRAAGDPLFLADLQEVTRDFAHVDYEGDKA